MPIRMLLSMEMPIREIRDLLPPEVQNLLGILAIVSASMGFFLWFAGIKVARVFVAIFLGGAGALVAAWQLPQMIGIAPLTAGVVGFVAGTLVGVLTFKILQGLVLALCIGLAVGGVYYYWHTTASQATVQVASTETATQATSAPAEEMVIKVTNEGPPTTAKAISSVTTFYKKVVERWNMLPLRQQRPIMIFSLSAAVLTLLLAFSYPRQTTWLATATIGSLMLFGGWHAACLTYAPQYSGYFPTAPVSRYVALALLIAAGLLVQYKLFWPASARKAKEKEETPLARGPENT